MIRHWKILTFGFPTRNRRNPGEDWERCKLAVSKKIGTECRAWWKIKNTSIFNSRPIITPWGLSNQQYEINFSFPDRVTPNGLGREVKTVAGKMAAPDGQTDTDSYVFADFRPRPPERRSATFPTSPLPPDTDLSSRCSLQVNYTDWQLLTRDITRS